MENELHQQKVVILSRLIKETSLTLEEALVLLKENEEKVLDGPVEPLIQYPSFPTYNPGQTFRHSFPHDPYKGVVTTSSNVGIGTTTSSDTTLLNIPSPEPADLNN